MSPSMMKAVLLNAYGAPKQAFSVSSAPKPVLDEGSENVLVRVRAASINPVDYKIAEGAVKMMFLEKFPAGVGCDLSGVVQAAGRGTGFKPGDEVFGCMDMNALGSMAEYALIPAANIALKPKSLSHEETACLPIVGLTALQALRRHKGAKDVAFIPAGLGGVGSIALQLAKSHFHFAHTITTVSTAKVALLKSTIPDVDVVVDYKTVDPSTVIAEGSCDFILDPLGTPAAWVRYLSKSPERGASVVSILAVPGSEILEHGWGKKLPWYMRGVVDLMAWWTRWWIPKPIHYESIVAMRSKSDCQTLAELADTGVVKPIVYKVFPLDQAVEAFELAASGKAAGKVVIRMSD